MTCIVALEDGPSVVVGCDAFIGGESDRDLIDRPKWWRIGRALVAFAGSFNVAQLAESARVRTPSRGTRPRAFALYLAREWRKVCAEVTREEPSLLVAIGGEAWVIQGDWSVVRSSHGYASIGCGAPVALGALAALTAPAATANAPAPHIGTDDAEARVRRALEASARHTAQVSAPFHVLRV